MHLSRTTTDLLAMLARLLTWGTMCLALLLTGLSAPSYAEASADEDGLAAAARVNHMSVEELSRILADDSAHLDTTGRLYFVDPAPEVPAAEAAVSRAAPYPYDQTFQLHSLPGSNRTIFLDFDGHTVSNTAWNQGPRAIPETFYAGMNIDSVAGFSDAEQDVIQEVFQRVAEDFAPMNVDVTTEDPGVAALERADQADQQFGMRALVSDDPVPLQTLCSGGCGGIAYFEAFDQWLNYPGQVQPAWIFPGRVNHVPQTIADAVSHEVGHNLGLSHDGQTGGIDYYGGQGVWLPIMGSGYRQVSQWSNGDYQNANNQEDDFSLMASHGALTRTDDYANTAAGATAVDEYGSYPGVIATRTDLDWFTVEHCGGPLSVSVTPAPVGPNLNIRLTVQTSAGATLATVNPPSDFAILQLGASYAATQSAGTYRLAVDGAGEGSPAVDGFSDYGSVGQYALAVDTSCTTHHAPTAPQVFTVETADSGTAATLGWTAPASDGGEPVTTYTVQRTGGTPVVLDAALRSHTFSGLAIGTSYTFTVKATNVVGTGPVASLTRTTPKAATAPQGLYATSIASGEADLHWATPLNDGGRPISGYVVQRTGGSPVNLPAGAREHNFTGLVSGTYTLSVRAVTAFGPGAVATTSYLEPGPPSAPQNVSAVATSSSFVEVTWGVPASNGGSPIVLFSVTLNGNTQTVSASNPRIAMFGSLAADTTYVASVTASNSFGPGTAGTDSVRTPVVEHAPSAVQSLTFVGATPTSVTVSWAPPSDLGGPPLHRYEARIGSGTWVQLPTTARERTFTGLAGNTSYTVSVRAVNSWDNGASTNVLTLTDPSVRPGTPRIGTAVSGVSGGYVTAAAVWRAPLSNGGSPIKSYKVTALKMSSSGTVLRRFTKTVGPTVRKTTMVLPAGRYRFQVVAINAVGTSALSARSNLVTAR